MKHGFLLFGLIVLLVGAAFSVLQLQKHLLQGNALVPHKPTPQVWAPPPTPTPTPVPHRPSFATGVVFPQWGAVAYSQQDTNWQSGLQQIKQLHARWIAMTLPFHMTNPQSTLVETRGDTPTLQAFQEGLVQAHQLGFHVFVSPLITVDGLHSWAGYISFFSVLQARAWFASYWQVLSPYLRLMQQEQVEMFSIGHEYELLQNESSALWKQLIQQVRAVFSGQVIYSINWSSLTQPLPAWFADLDTVGCSTYFSVTPTMQRLTESQAVDLWKSNVQTLLDYTAQRVGKPIVITEIGYRSGVTAGYLPYVGERQEPADDQEQAILYNAAMQNLSTDQNVNGIFWWAWSTPPYSPNGKVAAQVLTHWFWYL